MSTQQLYVDSERLRAVAVVNGKARSPVFLYDRAALDREPLAADEMNIVSRDARDAFLAQLPDTRQGEARTLLARLAASVAESRSSKPRRASPDTDGDASVTTEDSLALEFSNRYGNELRYVAQWGKWMRWGGDRWSEDNTLNTWHLVRGVCREIAEPLEKPAVRAAMLRGSTVAAVERLARSDRRHAATPEQFDADPWLLNTPGGTIDLTSGALRPHDPSDHQTKCTAVAIGGPHAQWSEFLRWVTVGDKELEGFLQRWFGYCLTGVTREEKLVFGYGDGGNGKGTMVGAIQGILGDYAMTSQMETFTLSRDERHPTELAALRGARFVVAQETQQGRTWNESRIKALTGGDRIQARYMRQDFFEFAPAFKLMLFGNHKPSLRSVDAAIKRRLLLVPFNAHVTNQDDELKDKLRAEWGGILEWMVNGCLAWQRDGLRPPERVLEATAEYMESQDSFTEWLESRCVVYPEQLRTEKDAPWCSSATLFESWKGFSEEAGIPAGSRKAFGAELEKRGFPATKDRKSNRGFGGIVVQKPPELLPDAEDYYAA